MTNLTDPTGTFGIANYATDAYTPYPALLAGSVDVDTSAGTLLNPAADLPAYSLLGRITSTGKLTLSNQAASDGSQIPVGITIGFLPNPAADATVRFYRSGTFNYNALNLGTGWTLALLRIACETSGAELYFEIPGTATPTSET
jgi:hypothetical protein